MEFDYSIWSHGEHTIGIRDNVLEIRASGAFNEYGLQKFRHNYERLKGSLVAPWSTVAWFDEPCQVTPAAIEEFKQHVIKARKEGLSASAIVLSDPKGRDFSRRQFSSVYDSIGHLWSVHNSLESAWDWIKEWKSTAQ